MGTAYHNDEDKQMEVNSVPSDHSRNAFACTTQDDARGSWKTKGNRDISHRIHAKAIRARKSIKAPGDEADIATFPLDISNSHD